MAISNNTRLIIFALFGAVLGFLFSLMYLIVYYGSVYNQPVSDAIRSNNTLQITLLIWIALGTTSFGVYHRKAIIDSFVFKKDDQSE